MKTIVFTTPSYGQEMGVPVDVDDDERAEELVAGGLARYAGEEPKRPARRAAKTAAKKAAAKKAAAPTPEPDPS